MVQNNRFKENNKHSENHQSMTRTSTSSAITIGALLFPFGVMKWNRKVLLVAEMCWRVAGALFALFSAMNYFMHIGLPIDTSDSF